MNIGSINLTSPLRLAPMADISNAPFRLVAKECGSALVTSEEIEAKAYVMGIPDVVQAANYLPEEHPIAMQLLGEDPAILAEAAKRLEAHGADIVDLNMGCPVPKITNKGQGAALMKDTAKVIDIFRAILKAIRIPFTIKIRGGWDEIHINAPEIARIAEAEGVSAITVHPRTRSQRFTGKAPWEIIADVVQAVKIPVTGNGDVHSQEDARQMMEQTGCQSVMIGRGALGKPWIFDTGFDSMTPDRQMEYKLRVIRRHKDLILQHIPEREVLFQLRKNLVWYMTGLRGAAAVRQQIFQSPTVDAAWETFLHHWEKHVTSLTSA